MFDLPNSEEFTQGTVFSCAYAENYMECAVFGLVITARCDVAQDKVPVFSYLPTVALDQWILNDGASILLDRIEADCVNSLKNLLKIANISDSLLKTHPPEAIYEAHFRQHENSKSRTTQCEKFQSTIGLLNDVKSLQENKSDKKKLADTLRKNQNKVDALLKELSGHRLTGYYLLRQLETYTETEKDFVVLLREVHHIPATIAKKIAKGLSELQKTKESNLCPKFYHQNDIALPIAKLKSPWIEHLMQNFSLLFSRIGVKDNDFDDLKRSFKLFDQGKK